MKELKITSGDKRIYGMLYEPAGEGKHPAVLMSHGYNGSHTDWVNEGEYYSRHGYVVYAYDFCGGSSHSLSSGRSTEMSVLSEKEDLMTVFDYVRKLDNVDPDRIVLFGGKFHAIQLLDRCSGGLSQNSINRHHLYFKLLVVILYFLVFSGGLDRVKHNEFVDGGSAIVSAIIIGAEVAVQSGGNPLAVHVLHIPSDG